MSSSHAAAHNLALSPLPKAASGSRKAEQSWQFAVRIVPQEGCVHQLVPRQVFHLVPAGMPAHLRIAKITDLQERPDAVPAVMVQQQVLQLQVTIGDALPHATTKASISSLSSHQQAKTLPFQFSEVLFRH